MAFTLKVQGLDRLQKVFHQLPVTARKELKAELKITAGELRDAAKRDAPKDVTRLQNAISFKDTGPLQFEVSAQTTYAAYLEFGTKTKVKVPHGLESIAIQFKGPAPGQGDPITALAGWLSRTGRNYAPKKSKHRNIKPQSLRSAAWGLFLYLMKVGINPQPYFFKQVEPSQNKLQQRLVNFIKRII